MLANITKRINFIKSTTTIISDNMNINVHKEKKGKINKSMSAIIWKYMEAKK